MEAVSVAESATGRKESAQRKLAEEMRYKPSAGAALEAVSYTHLTLPTIHLV